MIYYAGLDVSLEETSVCVMDEKGHVVQETKVASKWEAIAKVLRPIAASLARVGLEAGPLSPWLCDGLREAGFAAICIETRHLKASLGAMRNKTDRNDARGIAQLVPGGPCQERRKPPAAAPTEQPKDLAAQGNRH
jgi:transposase